MSFHEIHYEHWIEKIGLKPFGGNFQENYIYASSLSWVDPNEIQWKEERERGKMKKKSANLNHITSALTKITVIRYKSTNNSHHANRIMEGYWFADLFWYRCNIEYVLNKCASNLHESCKTLYTTFILSSIRVQSIDFSMLKYIFWISHSDNVRTCCSERYRAHHSNEHTIAKHHDRYAIKSNPPNQINGNFWLWASLTTELNLIYEEPAPLLW